MHHQHSSCVSLCVRYLSGRVFILDLMPGSQAHVDKFTCPGDIIDEINGTSLRNSKNGQVRKTSIQVITHDIFIDIICCSLCRHCVDGIDKKPSCFFKHVFWYLAKKC